jgi:hypothetical protein
MVQPTEAGATTPGRFYDDISELMHAYSMDPEAVPVWKLMACSGTVAALSFIGLVYYFDVTAAGVAAVAPDPKLLIFEVVLLAAIGAALLVFLRGALCAQPLLVRCFSCRVADGYSAVLTNVAGFGVCAIFGAFIWRNGWLAALALGVFCKAGESIACKLMAKAKPEASSLTESEEVVTHSRAGAGLRKGFLVAR